MNFETSIERYRQMSVGEMCKAHLQFWDGIRAQETGIKVQQITALALGSILCFCYLRNRGPKLLQNRSLVLSFNGALAGVELLRSHFYSVIKAKQETCLKELSFALSHPELEKSQADTAVKAQREKLTVSEWNLFLFQFGSLHPVLFIKYFTSFDLESEPLRSEHLANALKRLVILRSANKLSLIRPNTRYNRQEFHSEKTNLLTKDKFIELLDTLSLAPKKAFELLKLLLEDSKFMMLGVKFQNKAAPISIRASLTISMLLQCVKSGEDSAVLVAVKEGGATSNTHEALLYVYNWAIKECCAILTDEELDTKSAPSRLKPGFSRAFYEALEVDIAYSDLLKSAQEKK